MLMISTFLPLIFANLPPFVKSHHIWTIAWFSSLIIFKFKYIITSQIGLIVAYGLVFILILLNTIYIDVDEWNHNYILREYYEISVAMTVLVFFRMEGDYEGLAKILKWTMIFILITSIMSIITATINPFYARNIIAVSSAASESEKEMILSYQKYGGGGYAFATALVCLFPIVIYYLKNNRESYFKKPTLWIFMVISFFALLSMQIFANIIIVGVILIFSFLGSKNAKRGFVTVGVITLILLFIPAHIYVDIFQSMAMWFNPDSEMYYKMNDTATFFSTGRSYEDSSIGGRAARYPLLWDSFTANPWFGHYFSIYKYRDISEGGHLYFMNKLAIYGLLGFIPFIYMIYRFIKKNVRSFDSEYAFYYLLSVLGFVLLGLMKAVVGREFWYTFLFIIPGLYYLPLLKKNYHGQ
jgi:hypothetical protein